MRAPDASREAAASLQAQRGKPAWREAMRTLPVAEKLALLERAIREARRMSLRETHPYDAGAVVRPLTSDDDILGEMLAR